MHIKAKLYPYPVLANFNNDYNNSSFNINIAIQSSSSELSLQLNPELQNDEILELVKENKASFIIHIECPLTSYRQIIKVSNAGQKFTIFANNIEGLVTVCPFIIANEDIFNYTNKLFNKDYNGATFDLEKGNIIAIGQEVQIRLEKENDDLANIPSIFAVTEIKDVDAKDIIINNLGNKINVQLPSESFFEFKLAMANPNSTSVLHSMIIIPALMKCFDDMKSRPDELYIYEERRWFRALKKALLKINFELTEETILSLDSFSVSQKLMDNTTIRGLFRINEIAYKGDPNDE